VAKLGLRQSPLTIASDIGHLGLDKNDLQDIFLLASPA